MERQANHLGEMRQGIDRARTGTIVVHGKPYPEWAEASGYYKYFWWGDTNGSGDYVYSAIGRWGQFIFVAPKANVVIVRTGSDFGINIV